LCENLAGHRGPANDRLLYLTKTIPPAKFFDLAHGPGTVIPCTDNDRVRLFDRSRVVLQFFIGPVEEVFDGPRHVAEIFRLTKHDRIAFPDVPGIRIKGLLEEYPRIGCAHDPVGYRFRQFFRVARLRVVRDEYIRHVQTSRFDYLGRIAPFNARAVFRRLRRFRASVFPGAVQHHAHARTVGLKDRFVSRPAKGGITFRRFGGGYAETGVIILLDGLVPFRARKVYAGKVVGLGIRWSRHYGTHCYGDQCEKQAKFHVTPYLI